MKRILCLITILISTLFVGCKSVPTTASKQLQDIKVVVDDSSKGIVEDANNIKLEATSIEQNAPKGSSANSIYVARIIGLADHIIVYCKTLDEKVSIPLTNAILDTQKLEQKVTDLQQSIDDPFRKTLWVIETGSLLLGIAALAAFFAIPTLLGKNTTWLYISGAGFLSFAVCLTLDKYLKIVEISCGIAIICGIALGLWQLWKHRKTVFTLDNAAKELTQTGEAAKIVLNNLGSVGKAASDKIFGQVADKLQSEDTKAIIDNNQTSESAITAVEAVQSTNG